MTYMSRLTTALLVSVLSGAACSGKSGSSNTGGGTNPPPTTPTPTNTWSAAGQVVATGTSQGVGGATLTPGWALAAVTADGQGNYLLGAPANPPTTPYPVTVAASGFVSHDVWIT